MRRYKYGPKKPKHVPDRRSRERGVVPPEGFVRINVQVQIAGTEDITNGRIFLHDLTVDGVGIFLPHALPKGSEIFFVIEHPRHLFLRGRVAWCNLFQLNTRVITAENFQYRAGIKFDFDTHEDRTLVGEYFNELTGRVRKAA